MKWFIAVASVLVVAAASSGVPRTAVAAKVYWTTDGNGSNNSIQRASLDGTNVETILTGLPQPNGIAIDSSAHKVYWTDVVPNLIRRANLDGTDSEVVLSAVPFSEGARALVLDAEHGAMYWTGSIADGSQFNDQVFTSDLNGGGKHSIVNGGIGQSFFGITIDRETGLVYWAGEDQDKIWKLDVAQGSLVWDTDHPVWLAVDHLSGKLFWTNGGQIVAANLDASGSVSPPIIVGTNIGGIAIDPTVRKIYWAEGHSIKTANLDGSQAETIVSGLPFEARGLALDLTPVPEPTTCGASCCSAF